MSEKKKLLLGGTVSVAVQVIMNETRILLLEVGFDYTLLDSIYIICHRDCRMNKLCGERTPWWGGLAKCELPKGHEGKHKALGLYWDDEFYKKFIKKNTGVRTRS